MFDAGFTEILLILVIALLVVGPERLPGVARKVGLWVGKARAYFNSVRSDIERELRADELKQILAKQEQEIQQLRNMMQDTGQELEKQARETEHLVKAIDDEPRSESSSGGEPAALTEDRPAGRQSDSSASSDEQQR